MIVQVFLRISGDDHTPALLSEQARMYVHKAPDVESNLLGSAGLLDQMIEEGRELMHAQVRDHLGAERAGEFQRKPS